MKHRAFDILGNIAIVNFRDEDKSTDKKKFACEILKRHPNVKTVLEKTGKFKGRLRKMETKYVFGEKTKEVLYKENNCVFRFNIDKTYFSPRLSNERKEVSQIVKKNDEVFVMFAGVAPFSIVLAKNSKARKIYSNELNREANKYAKINVKLNKLEDKIVFVDGDIKKISTKVGKKFDLIVMPRPQLKDSFLNEAFVLSKKGTKVIYYDFCAVEDKEKIVEMVKEEAVKSNKKIKILRVKSAGEISPYKIRIRVDFLVF